MARFLTRLFFGGGQTAPTPPAAPTLTATPGNGQVSLAWTDGATHGSAITAHKLYAGSLPGLETLVGTITTPSPYVDTGLTNGTPRSYRLSAVNALGEGALSIEASATPVAVAPIVINRAAAPYSDDFETAGAISGRANWVIGTPAQASYWQATSGYIKQTQLYAGANSVVFGPAFTDFTSSLGYNRTGAGEPNGWDNRQIYVFWWKDESNYAYAAFNDNTATSSITIRAVQSGTDSALASFFTSQPLLTAGDLTIQVKGNLLRVRVDGRWLERGNVYSYPYDSLDLTTITSANRTGKVGVNVSVNRYDVADYIGVGAPPLTIDHIEQFVGRDSTTASGGKAQLVGTYTGTPVRWVGRVLNYATGAVVADWADLTSITASAGAWSALVFLPTGGLYTVEAGYIDGAGLFYGSTSKPTMSGIRGITYGQSNSHKRAYNPTLARVTTPLAAGYVNPVDIGGPEGEWATSTNQGPSPAAYETARVAAVALGKPVGIQVAGVDGTAIAYLSPGQAGWTNFTTAIGRGRGIVEFVIWDQGEGDADNQTSNTVAPAYGNTFLNTLLPGFRSATGNPNIVVVISMVGRYASSSPPGTDPATIDATRESLRQEYLRIVAADSAVVLSDSKLGENHGGDSYHYTDYTDISRRGGWSVAKALGASVHDGRGPIATSATRSGATITLAINLNGATGLTGPTTASTSTNAQATPTLAGSFDGYQVSADNFATLLPISSIAVSGSNLVIALASAPSGSVKVRSFYGWSYDDSVLFYGSYSDTTPIPVFPIMVPLAAA